MDNSATKERMAQIMRLLADGHVSFTAAQDIIGRYSPVKPEQALTTYRSSPLEVVAPPNELVDLWEKAFPGSGIRVAIMLQAFVAWQPRLMPSVSKMTKKFRNSCAPWRDISGVDTNKPSFWHPEAWSTSKNGISYIGRLSDIWNEHRSLLFDLLEEVQPRCVHDGLFAQTLSQCLQRTMEEIMIRIRTEFQCSVNHPLVVLVDKEFYARILQASGFELAGRSEESAKYLSLLELWLAGNFPIGIHNNCVKVLVRP